MVSHALDELFCTVDRTTRPNDKLPSLSHLNGFALNSTLHNKRVALVSTCSSYLSFGLAVLLTINTFLRPNRQCIWSIQCFTSGINAICDFELTIIRNTNITNKTGMKVHISGWIFRNIVLESFWGSHFDFVWAHMNQQQNTNKNVVRYSYKVALHFSVQILNESLDRSKSCTPIGLWFHCQATITRFKFIWIVLKLCIKYLYSNFCEISK